MPDLAVPLPCAFRSGPSPTPRRPRQNPSASIPMVRTVGVAMAHRLLPAIGKTTPPRTRAMVPPSPPHPHQHRSVQDPARPRPGRPEASGQSPRGPRAGSLSRCRHETALAAKGDPCRPALPAPLPVGVTPSTAQGGVLVRSDTPVGSARLPPPARCLRRGDRARPPGSSPRGTAVRPASPAPACAARPSARATAPCPPARAGPGRPRPPPR